MKQGIPQKKLLGETHLIFYFQLQDSAWHVQGTRKYSLNRIMLCQSDSQMTSKGSRPLIAMSSDCGVAYRLASDQRNMAKVMRCHFCDSVT